MNKKVSEVRVTTDYSMFKFDPLNRDVTPSKVERLKPSLARTGGNLQSVLIDAKGYIIDGQHRVVACKELKLPVRYEIKTGGYTSKDIVEINNNQNDWTLSNYASLYAKEGNINYQIYLKYRKLFPDFKEGVLSAILENKYSLTNNTSGSLAHRGFQKGILTVAQEPKAKLMLQKLTEIGEFYKGYNKRGFVHAVIHLSNQPGFSWDKFITKMKIRSISLFDYPKATDFVKALTEIYNYRERNKITFNV